MSVIDPASVFEPAGRSAADSPAELLSPEEVRPLLRGRRRGRRQDPQPLLIAVLYRGGLRILEALAPTQRTSTRRPAAW